MTAHSSQSRVPRLCRAASPPRLTRFPPTDPSAVVAALVTAVLGLASGGVRSTAVRMPRTVHNEGKGGFAGLLTDIAVGPVMRCRRASRPSGLPEPRLLGVCISCPMRLLGPYARAPSV